MVRTCAATILALLVQFSCLRVAVCRSEIERHCTRGGSLLQLGKATHRTDLDISLAVGHHPFEQHKVMETVSNMLKSLAAGAQGMTFKEVILFYDARRPGPELQNFLEYAASMKSGGTIQKLVQLRWKDPKIKQAMGVPEAHVLTDPSVPAMYQYLFEECSTMFCAKFDGDVWAHGGGGIWQAAMLLANSQNEKDAFITPPTIGATYYTDHSSKRDDIFEYEGTPFPNALAVIPELVLASDQKQPECNAVPGYLSTRYLIAYRSRARKLFPMTLHENNLFEVSLPQGVVLQAACREGSGVGWMIHPPPGGAGTRMMKACSVAAVQAAVDMPVGLLVDTFNNMPELNWTVACSKHM
eukprot:TRINITY_DN92753_c0_g1_i1.p1 TRINITY_DN92753_c0_g1~~TRINITY_DN92753_c0_g1_i1.p1  ORF type:complete len:373 (+),score=61.85 TRINITY_DN92753_c0_g1_i1:56-1120(+)